jgi:hypothetical protein
MGSAISVDEARDRIKSALDAIDAGYDLLRDTPSDLVGNTFRVDVAERLETQERTNRGLMYRFFAEIADPPDEAGSVAKMRSQLWSRLHITPNEITRRFKLAVRIRPRRSLTGPTLMPELPELAAAVETGAIGDDHIRSVCRAIDVLPGSVSPADVMAAERKLVQHATKLDAGIVTKLGQRIADYLILMAFSATRIVPVAADCISGPRGPTGCRGCPDCSTRSAVPTSRRSRPRCERAATSRTTTPLREMTARLPSAATTH